MGTISSDDRLQRCELRKDAELEGVRVLVRELELVRRVDFSVQLDRLNWRPLEAQDLGAIGAVRCRGLDLEAAAERVRVVLQRDHALHNRRVRVDEHEAALDETR
jgi:hypothetical protein